MTRACVCVCVFIPCFYRDARVRQSGARNYCVRRFHHNHHRHHRRRRRHRRCSRPTFSSSPPLSHSLTLYLTLFHCRLWRLTVVLLLLLRLLLLLLPPHHSNSTISPIPHFICFAACSLARCLLTRAECFIQPCGATCVCRILCIYVYRRVKCVCLSMRVWAVGARARIVRHVGCREFGCCCMWIYILRSLQSLWYLHLDWFFFDNDPSTMKSPKGSSFPRNVHFSHSLAFWNIIRTRPTIRYVYTSNSCLP